MKKRNDCGCSVDCPEVSSHLIAAAPELLEAVKMIVPLLRLANYPNYDKDSELIKRFTALITKAEGK